MPKTDIHPKYFDAQFICTTCNSEFLSGSTKGTEIRVEICSNCHPFYTGQQNFMNAEGRVEKFKEKFVKKDAKLAAVKQASAIQKTENAKKAKSEDKK